jgi:eukaryotic-like serine/threonine-protein kinase
MNESKGPGGRVVGRYMLFDEIASGGMATVHLGRLCGPVGFSRTVAIKRLHPHFAKDPDFSSMFLDEARLAARIQHPNVVATVDVVTLGDELFLVMDYIQGETLSRLWRSAKGKNTTLPVRIAASVLADVLYGLHAAHEAKAEDGTPLDIVHRDVSPHNILVGRDGVARVLDFGVAKASARATTTREGQIKGKLAYMAPEQLQRRPLDRRTDVFAASIVLWESLTGHRLFSADDEGSIVTSILFEPIQPPSSVCPNVSKELDALVMKGLERDPDRRFETAHEMASALERTILVARPAEVGAYVESVVGEVLTERAKRISEIEGRAGSDAFEAQAAREEEPEGTLQLGRDVTNVSNITNLSIAAPVAPSRRYFRLAATVGVVAVGVLGTWLTLRTTLSSNEVSVEARASSVPSSPGPYALSKSPEPAAPPVEESVVDANASADLTAIPSIAASVPSAAAVRARPLSSHPVRPRLAVGPCDPPFLIDGDGVKRFKPQCF